MLQKINCSSVFILAQTTKRGCECSIDIVFRFKSFTRNTFFHTCKQPSIMWGEIWTEGRVCQHLPAPQLRQILHITLGMTCVFVLEQNDTILKHFWLFTAKRLPHIFLLVTQQSWSCTVAPMGTGWSRTSPYQQNNMTCLTFRASYLRRAILQYF